MILNTGQRRRHQEHDKADALQQLPEGPAVCVQLYTPVFRRERDLRPERLEPEERDLPVRLARSSLARRHGHEVDVLRNVPGLNYIF